MNVTTFPKLNCMGRLSCTSLIRKREMKKKHKENDSKLNWLVKISLKLLSMFTQILIRLGYVRICLVHFKVSSLCNYFINVLTGPSNMVLPNIFPRNACWSYLFIYFVFVLLDIIKCLGYNLEFGHELHVSYGSNSWSST